MKVTTVSSERAPKAVGPYSQAAQVESARLLFTAGQIAIDPATGVLDTSLDATAQTEQVLANLTAVLEAGGARLNSVVKTTVFLTDMADFPLMNAVYARVFGEHKPARSSIGVAALPLGARVEIEAVAAVVD